jgi:hypothetical protein
VRFWATGDSNNGLQYILQISKQTITETVPELCQAIVEALMENMQLKLRIVRSKLFSHKIDVLEH